MADMSTERGNEKLRATFFRSVTLVTSVSGIMLAGSEGVLFPAAMTPVFAVLGWILVDHLRWLNLSVIVGNLLGLFALGIASSEFIGGSLERKLLSGAHLIVYLTWIVLLLPKGNRQYWWLIALSLLQISISGVLSAGVSAGAAMMGMMALLLWTMSVFSLFRVQDQHARRTDALALQGLSGQTGNNGNFPLLTGDRQRHAPMSLRRRAIRFFRSFMGLENSSTKPGLQNGRNGSGGGQILVRNGLQRDPSDTWVGQRFRWMVAGSFFVSLVLALFVFAAFPRVWVPGTWLFGDAAEGARRFRSRTGFNVTVQLGRIGQLLQSNDRVLAFDVVDLKTQKAVTAKEFAEAMNMDEVRFRGNVLAYYSDGQWSRGLAEKGYPRGEESFRVGDILKQKSDFRVSIVQDPPQSALVFAPFPLSSATAGGTNRILQTEVSASLVWDGQNESEVISRAFTVECPRLDRNPAVTFERWSDAEDVPERAKKRTAAHRAEVASSLYLMDGFDGQFSEFIDGQWVSRTRVYRKDRDLKFKLPRLYQTANDLCREGSSLCSAPERIRRILAYLSTASGFEYSLMQKRSDRTLDPVEDFLFKTKSGHCEYFASACTLMLQSVGVPARLVNGYYGSEINTVTGKNEIRQRHAHSWVEAFVDDRWRTIEATPSAERRDTVTSAGSTSLVSNFQTAISDLWNDGIHRMSAERQQQFFAPVISAVKSFILGIRERGLLQAVKQDFADFLKSPERWVSWQGGTVTFLLMLFGVVLARLHVITRLQNLVRVVRERLSGNARASRSVIRFYEGFCLLCEKNGLQIRPSGSALENARLAVQEFESRLPSPELRELPGRIAKAFNEVRFGSVTLTEEQATGIGHDLTTFAAALESRSRTA